MMDITPYLDGNKSKIEAEEQLRLNYYQEDYEKAKRVALALSNAFSNVEVYLFGSLTTDLFEVDSDIDMPMGPSCAGARWNPLFHSVKLKNEAHIDGVLEGI